MFVTRAWAPAVVLLCLYLCLCVCVCVCLCLCFTVGSRLILCFVLRDSFNLWWCVVSYAQDHIARNLRAIREHSLSASRRTNAKNAVGILTSDRRDTWHKVRTRLAAQGDANKESLHVIDSALFVVCLDDFAPDTLSASSANCLTGTSEIQAGTQGATATNSLLFAHACARTRLTWTRVPDAVL